MRLFFVVLGLLLAPAARGYAHSLTAPVSVQADRDGNFSYAAVLTVGPGSFMTAGYDYIGTQNVSTGLFADCFCGPGCTLQEGYTSALTVRGKLTDPRQPGVVRVSYNACVGNSGLIALTTIQPASTAVPAFTSWLAALGFCLVATALWRLRLKEIERSASTS